MVLSFVCGLYFVNSNIRYRLTVLHILCVLFIVVTASVHNRAVVLCCLSRVTLVTAAGAIVQW